MLRGYVAPRLSPEDGRIATKKRQFRYRYDLNYDACLERRLGPCDLCGQQETAKNPVGTVKLLSVDHDHLSGENRGFLCSRCNTGLGMFGDDPVRLAKAIDYLACPPGCVPSILLACS